MSVTGTPLRTPLREIKSNYSTPKHNDLYSQQKNRTPKTSPGPALLLAIKLSAKKISTISIEENPDEETSLNKRVTVKDSRVTHFRKLLSSERERITGLCDRWDDLLSTFQQDCAKPSDAILGDIRTTVGQGRLIVRERFHQFKGLVDNCEFGTSEKPVTCEDLQGFWDMIYFQVEDVNTKFDLLDKCKLSGWDAKILKKSRPACNNDKKWLAKRRELKIRTASSSVSKARKEKLAEKRSEARKRLASAKADMKRLIQTNENKQISPAVICGKDDRVTFDAGFFKIDSPVKSPLLKTLSPTAANGSQSPCGTYSRKQTCTPGSITKSLPAAAVSSHAKLSTSRENRIENAVADTNVDILKKLEFVDPMLQDDSEKTDCLVEILLSDPPSILVHDTQTSTPITINAATVLPYFEEICQDSNGNKDVDSSPCIREGSVRRESGKGFVYGEFDPEKMLAVEIALSPPAAYSDNEINWRNDATEPEHGVSENTATAPQEVASRKSVYVECRECSRMQRNAENDSGPSCCASDAKTLNETFDTPVPAVEKAIDQLPQDPVPCTQTNVFSHTIEVQKIGQRSTQSSKLKENAEQSKALTKACEETPDLDSSDMSILIDEAAKNIEKVSGLLKHTPCREAQISRKGKIPSRTLAKSVSDAGTSTTPSAAKVSERDDILLATLQIVATQMESLQKLNDNCFMTPSKEMKRKEITMKRKLEKLESEMSALEVENSDLKTTLEMEKKNKESEAELTDEEKIMQLVFKVKETETPDIAYKPHYFRLLAKVQILEAELKAFEEVKPHLEELHTQISQTCEKLDRKSNDVIESAQKLEERKTELKEMEERDNRDLLESSKTVEELKLEISTVKEILAASEKGRSESFSLLESLRIEYDCVRNQYEVLERESSKLKEENFTSDEKIILLEEELDITSKMYTEQHDMAEALENKVKYLGQEIESAFTEFTFNIEHRDKMISSYEKQIDDLTVANTKLCQERKALQDGIETLEYVEDEMRSAQEQLAETEVLLKDSEAREADKKNIIEQLNLEMASLNQEIENGKLQYANLQEALDITKSDAHFMLQRREEELMYGKTGLDHLLNMMGEFTSTLSAKIAEEDREGECRIGEKLAGTSVTPHSGNRQDNEATGATKDPGSGLQSPSQFERPKSPTKDSNSIIWRVDNGVELLQSVISLCGDLQIQFQKNIDRQQFQNSVLHKQFAAVKDILADYDKKENELEQILTKRIDTLTRESEEKSTKLEDSSRTMRMLSDQNLELSKYKIKYEGLDDDLKTSRRGRSTKRRGSSVGALKFLP